MSTIFVSHSSKDEAAANEIYRRLKERGYRSVFLDFDPQDGIPAGRDWEMELYRNLRACRALIVLCSNHSMASRWCFAEITQAKSLGNPVFPIKIDECVVDGVLADRQVVDLSTEGEQGWERLWLGLERAGLDPRDDFGWSPGSTPYPGLNAFEEQYAAVYFGRENEIAKSLASLERMRRRGEPGLAFVLGASGSGKSSLIRAGVLPRLKKDPERWIIIPPFRPGQNPTAELARALSDAFPDDENKPRWTELRDRLVTNSTGNSSLADSSGLIEITREITSEWGQREATVLLIIDQYEELLDASLREESTKFFSILRSAVEAPGTRCLAVATLRSDFLADLQSHPAASGLNFESWPLGSMPVENFSRVIEGPAAREQLEFEPGLVQRLVKDTSTDDALPLLAFALREMYELCPKGPFTNDLYENQLGGIQGSVARVADEILATRKMTEDGERALRQALLQLVRVNREGQFVRRPAFWDDLPGKSHPVLDHFVENRLLVKSTVDERTIIEVAHEALFRVWDKLAGWLSEEREFLLWRGRLSNNLDEWEAAAQSESLLLQEERLSEAEHWLAERSDNLDSKQRDFIQQSTHRHEREEAESRRRRRLTITVLGGFTVVALLLASVALFQWQEAIASGKVIQAKELATRAELAFDDSGEGLVRSSELALESLQTATTLDGQIAWWRVMELLPGRSVTLTENHEGAEYVTATYSHDGSLLVTADDQGRVVIRDPATRAMRHKLKAEHSVFYLTLTPQSNLLAGVGGDSTTVWKLVPDALERSAKLTMLRGWSAEYLHTSNISFSPDGALLAIGLEREVLLINTETWEEMGIFPTGSYSMSVAFSPNGKRIAIGSTRGARVFDVSTATPAGEDWPRALRQEADAADVGGDLVAFTGNGDMLITGDRSDGAITSWTITTVEDQETPAQYQLVQDSPSVVIHHVSGMNQVSPVRGDKYILSVGGTTARLWLRETGREVFRMHHDGRVGQVAVSPNQDWIATGGEELRFWRFKGSETARLDHEHAAVKSAAFHPNGQWLGTGGSDGYARLFRSDPWHEVTRKKHQEPVHKTQFTPDGQAWITVAGNVVTVFKLETWRQLARLEHAQKVWKVLFSPDGTLMTVGTRAGISVYSTQDWVKQLMLPEATHNSEIRISHDGRWFVTWGGDSVTVHEIDGWQEVPIPGGAGGRVYLDSRTRTIGISRNTRKTKGHSVLWYESHSVAFSLQNGEKLAWRRVRTGEESVDEGENTGLLDEMKSWDDLQPLESGTTSDSQLWKAKKRENHVELKRDDRDVATLRHDDNVTTFVFSPDRRWIVTASEDGTAKVWPLDPNDMIKELEARLDHSYATEERDP